jgi:uncharacterized protein YyaL (SSP411 family)
MRTSASLSASLVAALSLLTLVSGAHTGDERRLAREPSPYLLAHANDAVDWYPWGAEAIERARKKERPLFLLLGRFGSARHLAIESAFLAEPEAIKMLADEYVPVLADRDERPDLADVYALAARAGGEPSAEELDGPLAAILTPEMRPLFVRPLRREVAGDLLRLALEYRQMRGDVETRAGVAAAALQCAQTSEPATTELGEASVAAAVSKGAEGFDAVHGSFSRRPNRPPLATLRLLLAEAERTRSATGLRVARRALEAMARGGLRDHVGGGFFRETADPEWQLPRFEKRLVDNALLLEAYVRLHALTGGDLAREAAQDVADWALRDMRDPSGAFILATGEEAGGDEGRFYRWTAEEIRKVLGPADGPAFLAAFRLSPAGVLSLAGPQSSAVRPLLERLRAVSEQRPRPPADERVCAGANGFMIAALARSGRVLDRPADLSAARRAAEAVFEQLGPPMELHRSARGSQLGGSPLLDDYTALAYGLLELFDATRDPRWAMHAGSLADEAIRRFHDPRGGFFATDEWHAPWPVRVKTAYDGEAPAANALMVEVLLRLEQASGEQRYGQFAREALRCFLGDLERAPGGLAGLAKAAGDALGLPPPPSTADAPRGPRATRGPVTLDLTLSPAQARAGQRVEAEVRLSLEESWGVVAASPLNEDLATLVVSLLDESIAAEPARQPEGQTTQPRWSPRPVSLLTREATVVLPLRVPRRMAAGERRLRLRLRYQACDARDCQPPESVILEAPLTVLPPGR